MQRLTGEIGLNEEKVVHIVPRLDGVVREVFKDLGDQVKEGELLAILESRELADVKIELSCRIKAIETWPYKIWKEKRLFMKTPKRC